MTPKQIHYETLGNLYLEYKSCPKIYSKQSLGKFLCERLYDSCKCNNKLCEASNEEIYSDAVSKNPKILKIVRD